MKRPLLLALLVATSAAVGNAAVAQGAQAPALVPTRNALPGNLVAFNGAIPAPMSFRPYELAILPQRTIAITVQEGGRSVTHTESGPYLSDVLAFLGWQPISACRNDVLRWWILASNQKGATALVTRGEIDPGFGNRPAILSISEDGRFVTAKGPRLIVPGDITGGRDITGVNQITVGRAASQVAQAGCDDVGKVPSPPSPGTVLIDGDVARPTLVPLSQLQALAQRQTTVSFLQGTSPQTPTEQGPLLEDVIDLAQPKFRSNCPDDALRFYVQASATDGYSSLLSWGDISSAYGNRSPLLSLMENGVPQTGGPRVLAPGDVRGGRYVAGTLILTVIRASPEVAPVKGC